MPNRQTIALVPALLLATLAMGGTSEAAPPPAAPPKAAPEKGAQTEKAITPPRLSYTDGDVSFWRPGAEDWTPSRLNTALAAGDRLYAGEGASLELELGGQAYVRAGEQTQIGIANLEPDFMQVEISSGQASLDVRNLQAGHTIEIDTPNAAFTVENTGYYRIDVEEDQTTFITRRGGQARVTPAGGSVAAVSPTEQVVVRGQQNPVVETYVAPDLDSWDRWNYARTDRLLESPSARYVPTGVAGTSDLDYYGRWRVVPTYGPVWVPTAVAPGWAPYSTGRWVWDPYYGWTWVDDAPWGWAPYHYGRWVNYSGYWAWAPGPIVAQPVYAPALVAFYAGNDFGVSVSFGGPAIGWAPLGWGEPCVPWWGPFYGTFWWGGWGGPYYGWHGHHHGHWDDDGDDHHHGHWGGDDGDDDGHHGHGDWDNHGNGGHRTFGDGHDDGGDGHHRRTVIVEPEGDFGRGRGEGRRVTQLPENGIEPIRGKPPVKVAAESLTPGIGRGTAPPGPIAARPVVATRTPHDPGKGLRDAGLSVPKGGPSFAPRAEVIKPPKLDLAPTAAMPRPPFGKNGGGERADPPPPPGAPRHAGKGGAPRPAATSKGRSYRRAGVTAALRPRSRDVAARSSSRTRRVPRRPPRRRGRGAGARRLRRPDRLAASSKLRHHRAPPERPRGKDVPTAGHRRTAAVAVLRFRNTAASVEAQVAVAFLPTAAAAADRTHRFLGRPRDTEEEAVVGRERTDGAVRWARPRRRCDRERRQRTAFVTCDGRPRTQPAGRTCK